MTTHACDPRDIQRRYGYNGAHALSTIRYQYYDADPSTAPQSTTAPHVPPSTPINAPCKVPQSTKSNVPMDTPPALPPPRVPSARPPAGKTLPAVPAAACSDCSPPTVSSCSGLVPAADGTYECIHRGGASNTPPCGEFDCMQINDGHGDGRVLQIKL